MVLTSLLRTLYFFTYLINLSNILKIFEISENDKFFVLFYFLHWGVPFLVLKQKDLEMKQL